MTDGELIQQLRLLATDADLSHNLHAADTLRLAAARLMEMTRYSQMNMSDLERLWEKAWQDSLESAVTTAIEHALHEQGVRTVGND